MMVKVISLSESPQLRALVHDRCHVDGLFTQTTSEEEEIDELVEQYVKPNRFESGQSLQVKRGI